MTDRQRSMAVCGGLALLVLVAVWAAPPLVGLYHDDGIYVGTAVSMARGEGYRVPHLPTNPGQAKYPPLYPALLVPVALAVGTEPGSLGAYRWPGALCLVAAIALLPGCFRRWGMGERGALLATAATALSPLVFQAALHPMSEAPFLLLLVGLARAWPATAAPLGTGRAAACAALAAGAVLCRTLGVALAPALVVAAWPRRRDWRAWTPLAALAAATLAWMLVARALRPAPEAMGPFDAYYVGYGDWIQGPGTLAMVLAGNVVDVWAGLGHACMGLRELGAWRDGWAVPAAALGTVVVAGAWLGRRDAAGPVVFAAATVAMVWGWPFPPERFLMPLTPVLVWALWRGGAAAVQRWRLPARVVPVAAGCLAATSLVADLWLFPTPSRLPLLSSTLDARAFDHAAQWIRANTPPDAVLISDHDPWVWLATGRRAVPPGVFDPLWRYGDGPSPHGWERAATDARDAGARWLVASVEWDPDFVKLWADPLVQKPRWPVVHGTVRRGVWIYDLGP